MFFVKKKKLKREIKKSTFNPLSSDLRCKWFLEHWFPTCCENRGYNFLTSLLVIKQKHKRLLCHNQLDLEPDIHPWESPATSFIKVTKSIGDLKEQGQASKYWKNLGDTQFH